jgi:hypothetical protein
MSTPIASAWSKIPWPAFAAICFALPVMGVGLTRQFALHGGPRIALASDDMLPLMVVKEDAQSPAAKQLAFDAQLAAAYERRAAEPVLRSPVVGARNNTARLNINPALPTMPVDVETEAVRLPATVAVTSILAAPTGNRAVIAGKLRSVGDEFLPGWRINAIDPDLGEVLCKHESGETATLRIRRPGRDEPDTLSPPSLPMPR